MRTKTKLSAAAVGLATTGALMLSSGGASGHGYTDLPISRQKLCQNGTVTNCGAIQWEPQSVEGPKGFPASGPADGRICSGNNTRFAEHTIFSLGVLRS
jgi:chitin-binding protein